MPTVIELNDGSVLKVHESVDQVKARLDAAGGQPVRFQQVTGATGIAHPAAVVDVRVERF
jgi:hypothetical protein